MDRVTTIVSDTGAGKSNFCIGGAALWALLGNRKVLLITLELSEAGVAGRLNRAGIPMPKDLVIYQGPLGLSSRDLINYVRDTHEVYELVVVDPVDLLTDFRDPTSGETLDLLQLGDELSKHAHDATVWMALSRSKTARLGRVEEKGCNCPGAPHAPSCPA